MNSIKWTEDVQLPDGRVVTLSRYEEFGGRYEPGQSPTSSASGFEFDHPDTKERIRYQGSHYFSTVALFIHDRATHLVLTYYLGGKGSDDGCPQPPYVFTKYVSGGWQRVAFKDSPIKALTQNMISGAKGKERAIASLSGKLSVTDVRRVGMPLDGPRRIDISGLDGPRLACPERLNLQRYETPLGKKGPK